MSSRNRVLVVDDEDSMRELLEIVLGKDGYDVESVPGIDAACTALQGETFDAVLTDLRMGSDRDAGMRLLAWLKDSAPTTPAIMITAYGSLETAIQAMKLGAADYITKPFQNDEIRLKVRSAIEKRDLVRENVALRMDQAARAKLDNIVGKSAAIERVREMMRRVAMLPSTVAIHGESGTGKELVARGIHELSPRANKPFVAINCGGVPENLLESELFGYRRGAFTGALQDKEGLFVAADGGTLFLDEIGEMPLALQVKLLRILDDNIVMPVGGTTGVKVDVRIISATNRNLEQMVEKNVFRKDLFYRLNVIPIHVPPLRDHPDDIPLLTRHFITVHAAKMGRGAMQIPPEAQAAIQNYQWPGNVRELENVIERAVALCTGDRIELADLPDNVRNFVPGPSQDVKQLPPGGLDLEGLISSIEVNLIDQALKRTRYSKKRAAHLLGLTPRSLRYRLQKYGLDTEDSATPNDIE